jgi:hypothetical protein
MNRNETKCAKMERYKTKAEAEAVAARKQVKHVAYGCDCLGFHVARVAPTPKQAALAEREAYYGDLLRIVHSMMGREIARLEAAGVPRRKYKRNRG